MDSKREEMSTLEQVKSALKKDIDDYNSRSASKIRCPMRGVAGHVGEEPEL